MQEFLLRNSYNPFCLSPEQIETLKKIVPQVEFYFTDLRDGIQGASFSPSLENQKNVAELISHYINAVNGILEGGYAGATQNEQEKFEFLKENGINYSSFSSSTVSGKISEEHFEPMINSKSETCTIFVKCSDSQVGKVLKISQEENLGLIKDSIWYLKEKGKRVVVDMEHFFDGYYEEDKEYSKKCILTALECGVETVVLCDTLGKTSPIKVEKCILELCDNEKSSDLAEKIKGKLGLHLHEDNYYTKESIIRALSTGNVKHIQGNFGYAGERIGNSPLALLWVSLFENYDIDVFENHPNREKIWGNLQITYTQVSKLLTGNFPTKVDSILNFRNYIHAAGMHTGALDKDEKSYSIISCKLKKLLQIENYPGLTGQAGKSNVNYYLEPSGLLDGLDDEEKNALTNRILDFLKEPDALGYTGFLASFL
ncbi:MAG: hypothetical protein PHF46_03450, partial [Candidatus Gracilibacteria bacterium]|nr:hypothetical protein [Candidatus Gracilibacteria bacterium]